MRMCYQCGTQLADSEAEENNERVERLIEEDEHFAEELPVHCRPTDVEALKSGAVVLCTPCIDKAAENVKVPWAVMDGRQQALVCLRCGMKTPLGLPMDLSVFGAMAKEFAKTHRSCKEPAAEW